MMKVSLSILGLCVVGSALLFFSPKAPAQTQPSAVPVSTPTITGYELVRQNRVSRDVFDYTYRVRLTNAEPRLLNTVATATSSATGTTLIDNAASFGTVQIGATVPSTDTITIRQDRRYTFSTSSLQWTVNGTPDFTSQGGLLQGNSNAPAISVTTNYWSGEAFEASQVERVAGTPGVIRVAFTIEVRDEASVAEINTILRSFSAHIVSMTAGSPYITVKIPDPSSVLALQRIISEVAANPAVLSATPAYSAASPDLLPVPLSGSSFDPQTQTEISDVLAMNATPAWNAMNGIASRFSVDSPRLLLADYFGSGGMGTGLAAQVTGISAAPTCEENLQLGFGLDFAHGNAVLSKIAASFGIPTGVLSASPYDLLTSILPVDSAQPILGRVIDLCLGVQADSTIEDRLITIITLNHDQGKRTVINHSIGWVCDGGPCSDSVVEPAAKRWLTKLRGHNQLGVISDRENWFVLATSAGNFGRTGGLGRTNNQFAAATMRGDIPTGVLGEFAAKSQNTFVVENQLYSESVDGKATPSCLNASSNSDGTIAAIGSGLWVAPWDSSRTLFLEDGGTSLASPQIASLAAYMWAFRPDLGSDEIVARIVGSAHATDSVCPDRAPRPTANVYQALLAMDVAIASRDTAPIRTAILDVNNDSLFTDADVQQYVDVWAAIPSNGPPDYGRTDLNGDGFSGGKKKAAFNLNANLTANSGPDFEPSVVAPITTAGLTRTFDERSLTDHDILCYYIHSPLFTGDRNAADTALTSADPPSCLPQQFVFDNFGDKQFCAIPPPGEFGGLECRGQKIGYVAPFFSTPAEQQRKVAIAIDVPAGLTYTLAEVEVPVWDNGGPRPFAVYLKTSVGVAPGGLPGTGTEFVTSVYPPPKLIEQFFTSSSYPTMHSTYTTGSYVTNPIIVQGGTRIWVEVSASGADTSLVWSNARTPGGGTIAVSTSGGPYALTSVGVLPAVRVVLAPR